MYILNCAANGFAEMELDRVVDESAKDTWYNNDIGLFVWI